MRPVLTVLLTGIGTLLAGIPLLYLTAEAPRPPMQTTPEAETPTKETVTVTVEMSGTPQSCILRNASTGEELATMPSGTISPWISEIDLPQQNLIELEAEVHWADASAKNAAEITLTPPQKKDCSCTKWTEEGDTILHDIYEFRW